jgi:DNA-binding NarL/FixJ family response regulator
VAPSVIEVILIIFGGTLIGGGAYFVGRYRRLDEIRRIGRTAAPLPPAALSSMPPSAAPVPEQPPAAPQPSAGEPDTDLSPASEILTDREIEVLVLVAEGLSNREIGGRLEISPKTVARHRENLMRKLDLHSRTELVKYAIRQGLVKF